MSNQISHISHDPTITTTITATTTKRIKGKSKWRGEEGKGGRGKIKDFVGRKFPQSSANWGIDIVQGTHGESYYIEIYRSYCLCGHVHVCLCYEASLSYYLRWFIRVKVGNSKSRTRKKNNILSEIINHVLNNCAYTICAPLCLCLSLWACASNDLAIWVRDFWNTWCDADWGVCLVSPSLFLCIYIYIFGS